MIDERYTPRDKDVRCYICHGIDRYGDSTVFCPCCQVFVHYTCINDAIDYLVFLRRCSATLIMQALRPSLQSGHNSHRVAARCALGALVS
jgi:hypothetical protein